MNNVNEQRLEEWYQKFYKPHSKGSKFRESDFEDIATGFFLALGASLSEVDELWRECVNRNMG